MIVTVAVTRGFQREIREKVVGVGGHIRIQAIAQTDPKETPRVSMERGFLAALDSVEAIAHIQPYASLPGIVETVGGIEGVVVTGIDATYDQRFLSAHLTHGRGLRIDGVERRQEVLISQHIGDRLGIGLLDTITIHLVRGRDDIRARRFQVVGLYRTGLEQVDHQLVFVGLEHIQRFMQWGLKAEILVKDSCGPDGIRIEGLAFGGDRAYDLEWIGTDLHGPGPHALRLTGDSLIRMVVHDRSATIPDTAWIDFRLAPGSGEHPCAHDFVITTGGSGGSHDRYAGGFEVLLKRFADVDEWDDRIYREYLDPDLKSVSVKDRMPEIFAWLSLLDTNVAVVIALMVLVAVINMISALLIIILERTTMIGILKALGAGNGLVRRIFLIDGAYILALGILLGDVLGIGLCLLQRATGWVRLPIESYYVDAVPVDISTWAVVVLNLGTLAICVLALLLPSMLVTRIAPARAIRFA